MQPSTPFTARQAKLVSMLESTELDALVLNAGPTLTYLTGLHFHLMERPTVMIFTPGKTPAIVLPELESGKTNGLSFPVQLFPYGEDPAQWPGVFAQAAQVMGLAGRKVGVEPTRLRFLELRYLENSAQGAQFISAEESLALLRIRKDEAEIQAMRKAVDIAQRALQALLPQIRGGVSEAELASELSLQLLRAGSASEFPFQPIVSGGPNSANPHAVPSTRSLAKGDLLVIDWGAAWQDYYSDLTRTFAIGPVEPELTQIAAVVKDANAAAQAAARPGVTAGEVDQAARQVIEKAGYGPYFIHRTGHGLGMESHEAPYIRAGSALVLEPGMTFTIEPGIYLPGRNGVRIEDNMVITSSGAESLSDLPRDLLTLG